MHIFKLKFKNKSKYCKVEDCAVYADIIELAKKKFDLNADLEINFTDEDGTIIEEDCILDYINICTNAVAILIINTKNDELTADGDFSSSTSTLSINSNTPSAEAVREWVVLSNPSELRIVDTSGSDANLDYDETSLDITGIKQNAVVDSDGFLIPSEIPSRSTFSLGNESKIVNAMDLAVYLKKNGGQHIFEEYQKNKIISNRTRRDLVNLTVRMMTNRFGSSIPKTVKVDFAKAIVENFPNLKDPDSSKGGYEVFYDDSKRTPSGYLAWRLRTVVRTLTAGNAKRKCSDLNNEEEPVAKKKPILTEDDQTKIQFLKFACPSTQKDEILLQMKNTFEIRKDTTFSLNDYPRFLDTPGLIEQDFNLRFPEAQDFVSHFKEQAKNILSIYKSVSCQTSSVIISESDSETGWDIYTRALFAIIHMLPPTAKGKASTSVRPHLEQLFDRLLQFCKIGEPLEEIITKRQGHQPYLIAIGANKAAIHDYKVAIDGNFLETGSSCVVNAFDFLMKTHFVFQTKFDEGLENFFSFVQHFFYNIENVVLTTKMRELRNRLKNYETQN